MGYDAIEKVREIIAVNGLSVLWALVILGVGRLAARWLTDLVRGAMRRSKVDEVLVSFFGTMVYALLLTFVILAALARVGIETLSFVAVLGALGLAIGFALQGSLSNFAAGVLLILLRPFKAGDFIEGAGVGGIVEEIEIFTTIIRTGDNKKVIVPNAKLTGDNVINYSAKDTRRVDMVIGVGYEDNLKKVRSVIDEVLAADERILKDPAPTVGVCELGDNSVNFAVRPWVATADYWPVLFDTLETLKTRFDAEGITIPYPQRDVHLYQESKDA